MTEPPRRTGETAVLPLADLLSLLRPAPADTTVLRACLLGGEQANAALASWSGSGARADLLPLRRNRLFPLLAEAARYAELSLEPVVRSHLRAALASEDVRYEAYIRVLGPALAALAAERIDLLVLKGAALAETVYPRPELRHSHDVDLLIAPDQRASALACLRQLGWRASLDQSASDTDTLVHDSGLPLGLHTRLIRASLRPTDFGALRQRARAVPIAGVSVLTLSPADTLLHILGQAVTSGCFSSLQWACDAFFCVERSAELDWGLFVEELRKTRLALAYAGLVHYLRDELDLAVPSTAIATTERQAAQAPWWHQEAVVASLDAGGFGRRRMWAASRTWPTRLALLKWLLWPRSSLTRAITPGVPRWRLPLANLRRAATGARAQAQARAG